jgi:hypothetical protein
MAYLAGLKQLFKGLFDNSRAGLERKIWERGYINELIQFPTDLVFFINYLNIFSRNYNVFSRKKQRRGCELTM